MLKGTSRNFFYKIGFKWRRIFALEARLPFCSVPLFAGFLVCCCFFFFCFFFATFRLPESDEATSSSDVMLSQKTSRIVVVVLVDFAFATSTAQVDAPTTRNFLRGSDFRCRRDCFGVVGAASSFNESASIVRRAVLALLAVSLSPELRFTARCHSEFFFFDGFRLSTVRTVVRSASFNVWDDAFSVMACRFRRDFFRAFLASSLSSLSS